MTEKVKNPEFQELQIQEIMSELNECREDERSGRNQIYMILAAMATFITVIVTVLSIANNNDNFPVEIESLALGANIFSTLLLGAAVPWIANLGMLSSFRHFYIIELEKNLSSRLDDKDRDFYHWETISTPLITFNIKHVMSGVPMLYSLNMFISFTSLLALACAYVLFVQLFAKEFHIVNIVMTVWFWTVFFIVILTVMANSLKAEEIYNKTKEQAKNRRNGVYSASGLKHNMEIIHYIGYFVYPRIADIQKNVFLLFGFVLGLVISLTQNRNFQLAVLFGTISQALYRGIYVWFVVDFLVYQARYLWNDLRGIEADQNHPRKSKRKRLPVELFGEKTAIILAGCVIIFRLSAALVLIVLYAKELKWILLTVVAFLILISGFYEHARSKSNVKMTLALVPWGYSLRLIIGVLSAEPSFFQLAKTNNLYYMVTLCVLCSTAAFGETFVSLTWVLDAICMEQNRVNIEKAHYRYLTDMVDVFQKNKAYPLAYRDGLNVIWNKWYYWSVIFNTLATGIIVNAFTSDGGTIAVAVACGTSGMLIVRVFGCLSKKRNICGFILLIISMVIESAWQLRLGIGWGIFLYITIVTLRGIYAVIYLVFRQSNYDILMSFGDNVKQAVKMSIFYFLKVLLGQRAYEKIFPKRNN